MSDKKIEVPESQLTQLIEKNEELKKDVKQLYDGCIKILELLGLAEDGRFKSECFGPDSDNPLPQVLKSAGSIMLLAGQAGVPILGKQAEKKLLEKFGFFNPLIPTFLKYGEEFKK